jgi:small subunit ribosomal protein S6
MRDRRGQEAAISPVRKRDSNRFDFPSGRRYSYAQTEDEVLKVRDYEIVYVIRPDLSEEDRSAKVERIHSLITENGGELGKVEDWGKRVLAYEIRHNTEGYYGLAEFRLPPGSVKTVEGRLNIDEEILRYQIVCRS